MEGKMICLHCGRLAIFWSVTPIFENFLPRDIEIPNEFIRDEGSDILEGVLINPIIITEREGKMVVMSGAARLKAWIVEMGIDTPIPTVRSESSYLCLYCARKHLDKIFWMRRCH